MSGKKIKFKETVKKTAAFLWEHPALLIFVLSYVLAFGNEAMSRRSIWEAVVFVFTHPYMFLCNMSIIAVFEAVALLSKKRKFWLCVVSIFWFGLGLANFILMFNRITPFSAKDVGLLRSVFPILPVYLGWGGLILCIVAIIALIIGLIIAYFKTKKVKVNYGRSAITLLITVFLCFTLVGGGIASEAIPGHFSSLPRAYKNHGFTLCFSISVFDIGIDKPDGYDQNIGDIVSDVIGSEDNDPDDPTTTKETPNIIFVQLESFYDLTLLDGFEFSHDPTPFFASLRESCQSGILTVPSIGAGTANTEFEIISGMALKYFGAGEYPYETILQEKVCESICFILDEFGYTSHAVHNYKANFYSRKTAYASLGFDTFTSIEYMNGIEENILEWAHDDVLIKYVIDSLNYSKGPDFVQCITVQGHGQYPPSSYKGEKDELIDVISAPEGANKHSYKYLANQLYQTDRFIADLISAVEDTAEDTVIVFYGDHIPNIGMKESWLPDGMTLFDTEYIVWRSDHEAAPDKNMTSYQLSAEILKMLDLEGGVMPRLHNKRDEMDAETYDNYLHHFEYDILYGDCVVYGGEIPYKKTDIKLGLTDIVITNISSYGENIYIKGNGFTKSSKIFVNGSQKKTEFIDDNTLILSDTKLNAGDEIKVVQMADIFFHISSTDPFIFKAPDGKTPIKQSDIKPIIDVMIIIIALGLLSGLTATLIIRKKNKDKRCKHCNK